MPDDSLISELTFRSGDTSCAAWLYLPDGAPPERPVPVVVMGHGLGGTRELRLDAFAERFAAAGYACLVFDYRNFGDSGGEPRQLLDIGLQLEDWAAAIAFARSRAELDSKRVILWGTSFGGGHVITTAARDHRVAAAIAQCPFTDGISSALATGPIASARVVAQAVRDVVARVRRRPPVLIPIVGPPGSTAMMSTPDAEPGYMAMAPPGLVVRNEVAARIALSLIAYRPGRRASETTCPILFCICEHDSVAPAKASVRHTRRAPYGETKLYPVGHFDIYVGEPFEQVIGDQLDFLQRHVPA
jgi:pimeloyl-ACP methyl ester carboxylesterase